MMEQTSPLAIPGDKTPITLSLILEILVQGRKKVFRIALVVLALSVALAFILPTVYTSEATFVPPGTGSASASAMMGQLSSLGAGALLGVSGKSSGEMYVGILKSRSVELLLVQRFDLKTHYKAKTDAGAAATLLQRSNFEVDTKSGFVSVSVTDRNAAMARDLTDAYMRALQEVNGRISLTESSQRRLFYEHRLEQEKQELADAEVALQQTEKQTGLIAPGGQTATEIQALANLRAQTTGREVELAALLAHETEDNPDVIRLHKEISALQTQQQQMESGQKNGGFGRFSTSQVPELQTEYIRRSRDVKYHEALFDIIAKQYEIARLDEAKDAPVQVLDNADMPEVPSGPRRKLIIALGLLIGLVLGSAWVVGRAAFGPERR